MGGVEHVNELLKDRRRDAVILADRDEPKHRPDGSIWYPGREGAVRLCRAIRPCIRTVKTVKPPFHKDARAWRISGPTHDVVETAIRNTRYIA